MVPAECLRSELQSGSYLLRIPQNKEMAIVPWDVVPLYLQR